jgi:hypothetical protein
MKRLTIPLLLLVWTLGLAAMTGQAILPTNKALAQAPKARQKWEYASLMFEDAAMDLHRRAGKTTLDSPGSVTTPDPDRSIEELYRQMGGKEHNPTLGMLLNLIGQDGWEMVSFTHPSGVQIWVFKRASQ